MAMAVQRLFPQAQVTIGPWIASGFYYDFDLADTLTDKELKRIKKEMVGGEDGRHTESSRLHALMHTCAYSRLHVRVHATRPCTQRSRW